MIARQRPNLRTSGRTFPRNGLGVLLCAWAALCPAGAAPGQARQPDGTSALMVRAKSKPDRPWTQYPTRTLEQVEGLRPSGKPIPLSRYGGRTDRRQKATGYFRVQQVDGRWWLIDPEGCLFLHVGVVSVGPNLSAGSRAAFDERYGGMEKWAASAAGLLARYGFNGTGAWSEDAPLRAGPRPLVYTQNWNFMSGFGGSKKLTHQKPGHRGYPNDCFPVFHPEFEAWCDRAARSLAATKDDPYLLGHFSNNELPFPDRLLDKTLALEQSDAEMAHNLRAARQWLQRRKPLAGGGPASVRDITDADRDAFRGFVFDRYLEITTRAIRTHDPNHLCLGPRLHGQEKRSPAVFAAAGKHLDAIAVNYYGVWTPKADTLANWTRWSGRPVLITEWYVKGADVPGLANTTGAGWIVPTQADRGRFYQNYVLALLESRTCVGWHWFKYQDNDPKSRTADPSNLDSNKGIVDGQFQPYLPLLERMGELNSRVYELADRFDRAAR